MTVSRAVAKPLCTSAEFELANESFPPGIAGFSEKEIRSRVTRARKLRDKYRDVAEKQTREIKGRARPTRKRQPTGNKSTVFKQQFFAETLGRFEKRLAYFEARNAREAARANLKDALARKSDKPDDRPATRASKKGMRKKPTDKVEKFPNLQTMRGASRAAFARGQAKRDARRG